MSLAERLGYRAADKLLIISCDNLGCFHAANVAVYESLREGAATSASLMVPAPWSREAVRGYRGSDVGVHLTLNAEFECYRWRSITHSPSLHSGEGGFPRAAEDLWEHADAEEVRRECRAQIERAIVWGFDPTHLDSHLNALLFRPELFDVYLDLAVDFALPVRLADPEVEGRAGFPLRELAAEAGVLAPDRTLDVMADATLLELVEDLEAGVTEIVLRPAIDTPELRALETEASAAVHAHETLTDPTTAERLNELGVTLLSYDHLRTAQRS